MDAPRELEIEARGLAFHVVDWGGDGPPALLMHGTGFHARLWEPVARRLRERFRVLAYDARGHGRSSKPDLPYPWAETVADADAVVAALELERPLGIGHSFGGANLAGVAAEHPEAFSRIVLVDPVLVPPEVFAGTATHRSSTIAQMARKRRNGWPSREDARASYANKPPFDAWTDESLRLYVDHGTVAEAGEVRLACPPEIEARVFEGALTYDLWPRFGHVEAPALLVRGETSDVAPADRARRAVARMPRGRLEEIAGTGHFIPMEKPDELVRTILDFADAPAPPRRPKALAHLALHARDLAAMEAFYRDLFGMMVIWRPDDENVYLTSGRDNLALHAGRGATDDDTPALDHLGFLAETREDVFGLAEALAGRGLEPEQAPRDHRDGSCSLYVRDPDGNLVQMIWLPEEMTPGP